MKAVSKLGVCPEESSPKQLYDWPYDIQKFTEKSPPLSFARTPSAGDWILAGSMLRLLVALLAPGVNPGLPHPGAHAGLGQVQLLRDVADAPALADGCLN
jgi:hypothetical protein